MQTSKLGINNIYNKESHIKRMLDTFNSYSGMLKTRCGYKTLMRLKDSIGSEWWQFLEFNEDRLCLVTKDGYSWRERLNKKYNLKLKNHDTKRKRNAHTGAERKQTQSRG